MGYLAAVINKKGDDASNTVTRMLRTSSSQVSSYGFASNSQIEFFRDKPEFTTLISSKIIGYKANHHQYPEQPLQQGSQSLIMEGNIWDTEQRHPLPSQHNRKKPQKRPKENNH